jgi:F-type H+-transporting ATPase subunit b
MRFARLAVPALVVLLAPAIALASEEGGGHGGHLWWHLANLALVIGLIVYFARTPIRTFMAERRQNIEAGIESARRELAEAERLLAECNERIASLDREVEGIRNTVRAQAENERERLLADARSVAERIRRDAQLAVEQEARGARASLRNEAAEMAVRLAGDLLKRQVTDSDRSRLVDEFVERVESSPPAAANRS